jgi:hypothetical protein
MHEKIILKYISGKKKDEGCGPDSTDSRYGLIRGFSYDGKEPLDSIEQEVS